MINLIIIDACGRSATKVYKGLAAKSFFFLRVRRVRVTAGANGNRAFAPVCGVGIPPPARWPWGAKFNLHRWMAGGTGLSRGDGYNAAGICRGLDCKLVEA